jgi:integrase
MKRATAAIIQDTRRVKKGGKFPIKLRITYNGIVKYYQTDKNLNEVEYKRLHDEKPPKKFQEIRDDLFVLLSRAKEILHKLPNFSFPAFERKFYNESSGHPDLVNAFNDYVGVLRMEGRIGTALTFEFSLKSLQQFKAGVKFLDLSPDFLKSYEKWMLGKGKSLTTVGIYMRALRAIFNECIAEELIPKESYPFSKRKYQPPTGKNVKKALQLSDVKKIFEYKAPSGSTAEKARDFWVFSYLCNGMNMKDIARLKYGNIDGEYLTFIRAKTQRATRTNPKPITVYLNPNAKDIIKRWGHGRREPEGYLFPILEAGCSPERELELVRQFIKNVNKWIKIIASELGIEKEITTYTARHTFSTVLKRSGASVEFISEALGHADLKTTETYLDSFENESKKFHAELLTAFEKDKT